jgi:hypothetical protein
MLPPATQALAPSTRLARWPLESRPGSYPGRPSAADLFSRSIRAVSSCNSCGRSASRASWNQPQTLSPGGTKKGCQVGVAGVLLEWHKKHYAIVAIKIEHLRRTLEVGRDFLESGLVLAGMQASKSTLAPNNMYSDTRPIGSRMTSQLRLTFGHSRPGFFRFPQQVKAIAMPGGDAISLVARDSEKLIDGHAVDLDYQEG